MTDQTGMLRGDESIDVLGAERRDAARGQRQRQLEFLQITANPIDSQINWASPRPRRSIAAAGG